MRVIHIDQYEARQPTVVCVGNFDGVHRGHQSLIRQTVRAAGTYLPTVYTFSRHPANLLGGRETTPLITTNAERAAIFMQLGIRLTVMDPFRPALQGMLPEAFFEEMLVGRLRASAIVCGTRYHFGRDGAGDVRLLERLCAKAGLELHLIPPVRQDGRIISSSWVRESLLQGDVERAAQLLGRPYCLTAAVLPGDRLGRELGAPTANQAFPPLKLRPKEGVYATRLLLDGDLHYAATAVSARPTVRGGSADRQILAETHVLGYCGDLYGRVLQVEFLRRIRDIKAFSSLDLLREHLKLDLLEASAVADADRVRPNGQAEVES